MSTLPHNASDAVNAEARTAVTHLSGGDLEAAVQHFITTADALGAPRPDPDELRKMVHQAADWAREVFPRKLTIDTGVDPEIHDDVCLLFHVEAAGAIEEILALEDAWLRRVTPITKQWPGLFRLSIDAR